MEKYIIPSHADQPTNAAYNPATPATYARRVRPAQPVPVAADSRACRSGQDPLRASCRRAYGTGDIYGMHWLLDVDNTYGFGRCGDGDHARPAVHQHLPARPAGVGVGDRAAAVLRHVRARRPERLPRPVHRGRVVRQAVEVHQRPGRRRARRPGRLLGADSGPRRRARQADVAATVAKAAKMGDYLRYAMYDKYFKKLGLHRRHDLPGRHRQGQLALPAVLVLRLGRRDRHQRPAGRGASAPATTTSATRTRSRPGR